MRINLAYLDTSFIGGLLDEEFAEASMRVLEMIKKGTLRGAVSTLVEAELQPAANSVLPLYESDVKPHISFYEASEEIIPLAEAYIANGAIKQRSLNDALHVATATLAGCDLVISWNFKDLVNIECRRKIRATNLLHGLSTPEIVSPLEVVS